MRALSLSLNRGRNVNSGPVPKIPHTPSVLTMSLLMWASRAALSLYLGATLSEALCFKPGSISLNQRPEMSTPNSLSSLHPAVPRKGPSLTPVYDLHSTRSDIYMPASLALSPGSIISQGPDLPFALFCFGLTFPLGRRVARWCQMGM